MVAGSPYRGGPRKRTAPFVYRPWTYTLYLWALGMAARRRRVDGVPVRLYDDPRRVLELHWCLSAPLALLCAIAWAIRAAGRPRRRT